MKMTAVFGRGMAYGLHILSPDYCGRRRTNADMKNWRDRCPVIWRQAVIKTIGLICLFLLCLGPTARTVDYWANPGAAGVVEGSDCGQVAGISGLVEMRRSFMTDRERPLQLQVADRLQAGDDILVGPDGRLEWLFGANAVVTAAPGARVRLIGVRSFPGGSGIVVNRLDFEIIRGELRVQVRLNRVKPEAALVRLSGTETLLLRGDVAFSAAGGWRVGVLGGDAEVVLRKDGAPVSVKAGNTLSASGAVSSTAPEIAGILARLPFSFELTRLALPPLPAPGDDDEPRGP